MDGFNLLPQEWRTQRGARFVPVSLVVTLALAALALLLMEFGVITRTAGSAGSALCGTLADRRVDLARARQERSEVESQIGRYSQALAQTPVWSNLLIDVASVVEGSVWIEHWSSEVERGVCLIEGRAATNREVFGLVSALEDLGHFESVKLAGVAKEKDGQGQGVHYQIVCRLRQAAQ